MSHSPARRLRIATPLAEPCPHCGGTQPALFHSSCYQRAAWTPAQRGAFTLADRRSEALEREFGGAAFDPSSLERANPCRVPGCPSPVRAQGMCEMHYRRARKGADLAAPRRYREAA